MNYWKERVSIGSRSYPRFIGGPLDGYTDSPFRQLVRTWSTESLLYTEIRHVGTVAHARGAFNALRFNQRERPLQFQVTTNQLTLITRAFEKIIACGVDGIDLNIACPAKNVIKSSSGSALMGNLPLLESILKLMRSLTTLPLTIKMRAGFKEKNALEVVRLAQACGVNAIAIHPRLQTQQFGGTPDYNLVYNIKKTAQVPILYSGGIHSYTQALDVYEKTGVDGFLIGRALCGAPWKLAQIEAEALGKNFAIMPSDRCQAALNHLAFLIEYYGPRGLYNFRKHIPFYIQEQEGAVAARKKLLVTPHVNEVTNEFKKFFGV